MTLLKVILLVLRREPMSEASFSGSGRLCWGCFAAWAGSFGVTGDHLGLPGEIKGGAWSHQKRFCWFHGDETMNSGGGGLGARSGCRGPL